MEFLKVALENRSQNMLLCLDIEILLWNEELYQ